MKQQEDTRESPPAASPVPSISLPKGGGALRGIGEKFTSNPVTGTGSLTVPIAVSPGRQGFGPKLTLTYDSGSGNGPFGLGWTLSLPSITRRTDRGLPLYEDAAESDVFILSGAEDLVPALTQEAGGKWVLDSFPRDGYVVTRYRPRIEGLFARIERWTRTSDGDTYWRSISKDNITTFYGKTRESRIADLRDPSRVFTWLTCESFDDKGNAIVYEYVAEDSDNVDLSQVNERNRTNRGRSANRHLKRIKYGNIPSRLVQPDLAQLSWLFEVVFDYGEGHYAAQPPDPEGREFVTASLTPTQPWPVRQDPFSRYRACFEVRTYRLCRRVLMFHHFPDELEVPDYLVRATEFTYRESPIASFIIGVSQSGFVLQDDGTYLKRSLPTLEFDYSQAEVQQVVRDVDPESLVNLPSSIDGARYQWLDLDGEGLQCVLAQQDDGWYYKRNLSPLTFDYTNGQPSISAQFETLTKVMRLPAFAEATAPRHQFLDLAGDGQLDCVVLERPAAGFYKRTEEEDWETFAPLPSEPNVDWTDPNLRFVDVDGDGHADVLITEDEVLTWCRSLAEGGFGAPIRVAKARNEEEGPAIIFADRTRSIFLADMSGDGLTDIVRIRNGEVCYWPNLGYGQFGRKVTMDQSPCFDTPDLFDPRRIRLADIDGTGTSDIIYLAPDGIRLYFNQSGNALSEPETLAAFPPIDNISTVQALDLLGNGTASLIWMSPLPGDVRQSLRYVDLMGGEKPHLLIRTRNNMGAETRIFYAPSTKFYLADREAGQPWVTRLPFPVQVVERVETYDWVSRNRFVTRYAYHHGYYDGIEREFRGFGMVEQRDTEELGVLTARSTFPEATNVDATSYVPPVLTKTWLHTGAYPQGPRVSRVYAEEYYNDPDLLVLPDTVLPPELTDDEIREAIRSLKGVMLRREVYALDGTDATDRPYGVSERNYTINRLQSIDGNRHAVFFTHARESIDFQYERKLYDVGGRQFADPRVAHSMVLAVDNYGNELRSVAIAYGRRHDDPDPLLTEDDRATQRKIHVTDTESAYTNSILADDAYRAPLPAESRTYELIKVTPNISDIANLFGFDEMVSKVSQAGDGQHDLPYEDVYATGATADHPYRRLIRHVRTLYRKDDLTDGLQLGTLESMALPFKGYRLAFTPGLLSVYQGAQQNLLPDPASVLRDKGGYILSDDQKALGLFPPTDPDGHWWIPSGQVFYSPNTTDTAGQELANAQSHFFVGRRFRDPFGDNTTVLCDAHDLLILETENALNSKVTAGERDSNDNIITNRNNYRVLQPALVTDSNRNRSEVKFDGLGLVVGMAVMGKSTDTPPLGDLLVGPPPTGVFVADLTQHDVDQFFSNPTGPSAATLLGEATSRIVYDLGRFGRGTPATPSPIYAATIVRETHVSDLRPSGPSRLLVSVSFSDGFGREIQRKIQAEPGSLVPDGPTVDPRWVGTGWTIFNNKGKPVRQYEPFFDDTHDFRFGAAVGVSPTLFYDPVGRVVATLHPNQSWEKVVFNPWRQESWDVNDTVLVPDPTLDPEASPFFQRIPAADYLPTWYEQRINGALGAEEQDAAQKAAAHANTPTTAQSDTLGRTFLTIAYNRFKSNGSTVEEHHRTLVELDIEGNQRSVTDALARKVLTYDYDMMGTRIHQQSADAGERWMLNNVTGKPQRTWTWDSVGIQIREIQHEYDPLRRPTNLLVQTGNSTPQLAEEIVYGEGQANDQQLNLRGKVFQQFDGAGVVTNNQYDFKGNLKSSTRQLLQNYADQVDWSQSPLLEEETFTGTTMYDALNRPIQLLAPKSSDVNATFNIIQPVYNEANLVERLDAWLGQSLAPGGLLDPTTANFHPVTNIDYNAKGQRELIEYDSGAQTAYEYDTKTFRLTHLKTTRASDSVALQDLKYAYDPIGNITHIQDDSDIQNTVYFNNQRVDPSGDYVYDAIYRLTSSTGRELVGLVSQPWTTYDDSPRMGQILPTNGLAMQNYSERYQYDRVGNISVLSHAASNFTWTRTYAYDEPNLPPTNNRLTSTTVGGLVERYNYDSHGNMTRMPHLSTMEWDFTDQLHVIQRQVVNDGPGEKTYYVYDAAGQRVRKVTETASGTKERERIYLGGMFEVYREFGTTTLACETLHIMDGKRRIAIVDTSVAPNSLPSTTKRYQFDNHLGSACLELDENAAVISYEEYYPYGSTSYQGGRSVGEVGLKRYRYVGKERDLENGFYYYGARYYAPWLGRWVSCDPSGIGDGVNLFRFSLDNPITLKDPSGTQTQSIDERGRTVIDFPAKEIVSKPPSALASEEPTLEIARNPLVSRPPAFGKGFGKATEEGRRKWYLDKLGRYETLIKQSAQKHGIPPQLLAATILNELTDIRFEDIVKQRLRFGARAGFGSVGIAKIQIETAIEHGLVDISEAEISGYQQAHVGFTPGMHLPLIPNRQEAIRALTAEKLWTAGGAIEGGAREIKRILGTIQREPLGLWASNFLIGPPRENKDPQDIYQFVRGEVGTVPISSEAAREINLARLVAAAYNSPDILHAKNPGDPVLESQDPQAKEGTPYFNARMQAFDIMFIANDLFNMRLFR